MIDVCLLGTGGMMPLPDRWLTSLLVRINGRMILIDCGEGTQIPVNMAGWGFKSIDTVLFTHYHADHVAGLPGLLLTLGNSGREDPLILAGPPGLNNVVRGLTVVSPELPYELRLVELPDSENCELNTSLAIDTNNSDSIIIEENSNFNRNNILNNVTVRSIPVDHGMPCLAYSVDLKRHGEFSVVNAKRLKVPVNLWNHLQRGETVTMGDRVVKPEMVLGEQRKGIKVSYCTDTRPIAGLVDFVRDSDLFICEGMYGDDEDTVKAAEKKHMMFSEAADLAMRGNVKELWLTHYSPSLTEPEQYLDAARLIFSNTLTGKDLLIRTIKYPKKNY
jgi:ribonuclease Z